MPILGHAKKYHENINVSILENRRINKMDKNLKDNEMVVVMEDGSEVVCEIILTHEANGKNYVVFAFPDSDEISAALYVPGETDEMGEFMDIETDAEWDMLDEVLQSYYDELDELDEEVDDEDEE